LLFSAKSIIKSIVERMLSFMDNEELQPCNVPKGVSFSICVEVKKS
jgi:hypothetical protein